MKTWKWVGITLSFAAIAGPAYAGKETGGGDPCEQRILVVRDDLAAWIRAGGAQGLRLPEATTVKAYADAMLASIERAKVGCVGPGDPGFPIRVAGTAKVCRFEVGDGEERILCDRERLGATPPADRYPLLHHEFAGLAGIERSRGSESDYRVSSQLSDHLIEAIVPKLAVKSSSPAELEGLYRRVELTGVGGLCHARIRIEYDPFGRTVHYFDASDDRIPVDFIAVNQRPVEGTACSYTSPYCSPNGRYTKVTYADGSLEQRRFLSDRLEQPSERLILRRSGERLELYQSVFADEAPSLRCAYALEAPARYPGRSLSCAATGGQGELLRSLTVEGGHALEIRTDCADDRAQRLIFVIDGHRVPDFGVGTPRLSQNGSEPPLVTGGANHFESVDVDGQYRRFVSWTSVGAHYRGPDGSIEDTVRSFVRVSTLLELAGVRK